MNNQLDEVLTQVAEEVFESLVFMFPLDEEEQAPGGEEPCAQVTVRVSFSGPFSGCLLVSAPTEMLPALSANMLGMDYEGPARPDNEDDALKELTNVVCGNLLPIIAGPEAVFQVHAPDFVAEGVAAETAAGRVPTATAHLILDEGEAHLALFVDRWDREARNDPPELRWGMRPPHSGLTGSVASRRAFAGVRRER